MSGGLTKVHSVSAESEVRPVLVPAGNKARMTAAARKPLSKAIGKLVKGEDGEESMERSPSTATAPSPKQSTRSSSSTRSSPSPRNSPSPRPSPPANSAPPKALRRQDVLLRSNLSLNASCSSDCSTDSFRSRASTGRIGTRPSLTASRRRQAVPRPERPSSKPEKIVVPDGVPVEEFRGKRRCPWVTPNTDPCYALFHDEEWGVPVHDDKKLFELLVLSGALAELTWPVILSKRHIFREVFMDFEPIAVSKLNEKKLTAQGSIASSLLSEPKLRAVIENAHQIVKIMEEFGSFDRYCWNFVGYKPIVSRFRYPRQVPVKTPKAELISKDLVRRGFRSVGPTVIYSFMQIAGLTNDHLINCYRFEECCSSQAAVGGSDNKGNVQTNHSPQENPSSPMITDLNTLTDQEEAMNFDLDLAATVDDLTIS